MAPYDYSPSAATQYCSSDGSYRSNDYFSNNSYVIIDPTDAEKQEAIQLNAVYFKRFYSYFPARRALPVLIIKSIALRMMAGHRIRAPDKTLKRLTFARKL